MVHLSKFIHSHTGKLLMSALLGFGLATLFRKVCTDKKCIIFNGPIIGDFDKKTYQYDGKCYKYKTVASKCDSTKRIIDVTSPPTEPKPKAGLF